MMRISMGEWTWEQTHGLVGLAWPTTFSTTGFKGSTLNRHKSMLTVIGQRQAHILLLTQSTWASESLLINYNLIDRHGRKNCLV